MCERYLVKKTTREQREKIVRDSLGCGGGGCENCSTAGVTSIGSEVVIAN
jgi:hypothetical protein